MKERADFLMAKQRAGGRLIHSEIVELMEYALALLHEFGRLTDESIARARTALS